MAKKYPEAIAHYPKSMRIIIKRIHNRIESGKNALIIVCGQTGGGKSLSTISLMIGMHLYRFGKMPEVDEIVSHCIFKIKDLLKGLNNPKLKKKEKWNWDEAGVGAGHKTHATVTNRIIGYLGQTFRNLQQIVFFTVPSISFIDASLRKLFHYYLETHAIDEKKKICVIKPLIMQYNPRMDKVYYHNFTFPAEDGYLEEVDVMGVPIPPKEFVKAYEEKKNEFTRELNINLELQIDRIEAKENGKIKLPHRQKQIFDLLEKGITSTREISKILGIAESTVSTNFNYLDRRGIYIDDYRNSKKRKMNTIEIPAP